MAKPHIQENLSSQTKLEQNHKENDKKKVGLFQRVIRVFHSKVAKEERNTQIKTITKNENNFQSQRQEMKSAPPNLSEASYMLPKNSERIKSKKSAKVLSFVKKANYYRKHYLEDDNIERANKPQDATAITSVVGKAAQAIVAIARQKLCKTRTEWFMSDVYMSTITKCKKRQNRNIIGQINGTKFNIKHDRRRKGWIIKPLKTESTKRQNFAELQSATNLEETTVDAISYKNNSTRSTRSNADLISSQNSKKESSSCFQNENNSQIQNSSSNLQGTNSKKVSVIRKSKSIAPRRKTTKAQRKARVYHPKFKQYPKMQDLSHHYPLNTEDCAELQAMSGREFTLNAMNEILLDMSTRLHRTFCSRARFYAYFTKALKHEKRDAVACSNDNFYIKSNKTEAEIVAIKTHQEQQDFLAEFEDRAITSPCPENQLKAKWACTLPPNDAYRLLSSLRTLVKNSTVLEVNLTGKVELMESTKHRMLSETKAVGAFMDVEKLEFMAKMEKVL